MKKIRFFVVLLGLFALLGFSKIISAEGTVINVTITVLKNGDQVGDVVSTTGKLGGTITPEGLPTVTNGKFMFWTVNGVVRTDLPENPTIKVTSKMVLVAYYASKGVNEDPDEYSVAYLDTNTKLLHVDYVVSGQDLTPPPKEDVPGRLGASFDGWVPITNYAEAGIDLPENPGNKAFFVAKYTVTETAEYTVTVDGELLKTEGETNKYKLNDVVTVTSENPEFSYWKDETGAVLSYESSYTFTVLNANVTLTSVNEGEVDEPLVSIRRFVGYETGKNAFIGHYELDLTKYELVEVGFVHHDSATHHVTKNFNDATKEFMVVAPNTLSGDFKMRAYMTYKKIGSDELTTIYSINGIVKINNTEDFKAIAEATEEGMSKTYILTQNIEFPTEGWPQRFFVSPIGTSTKPFTGTFDGKGFTIAGFQGGDLEESFSIFGVIEKTGIVKNVGLIGRSQHTVNPLNIELDFSPKSNSAVVATVNKGLIENVYVQLNMTSTVSENPEVTYYASGLVLENYGTVRYIVSRVRVFEPTYTTPYPAFAHVNTGTASNIKIDADYTQATQFLTEANAEDDTIDGNYLLVDKFYEATTYSEFDSNIWLIREDYIPMLKNETTIIIHNNRFTINAVKETGVTIDATLNAYPEDVLTYALKEPVTGVSIDGNQVTVTNDAVHNSTFTVVVAIQGTSYGKEITFTVRNNPTSCAEVVEISTEAQLMALTEGDEEAMEKNYKLTADITILGWYTIPIGSATNPFFGTFDGQGHTITGFQSGEAENFGVFGVIGTNGVVKNLGLKGRSTIDGSGVDLDFYKYDNSAFVASVNYGTIENIYVEGIIESPGSLVAGIVAHNHGTINKVVSQVKVFKNTSEIGPAGVLTNTGTITNVFVNKGITGNTTFLPEASTLDSFLYAEVDFKAAATYTGILGLPLWEIVDGQVPKLKSQI